MTAMEWLVSQLNKQGFAQVVTDEEIQQAKEMEREQIIQAYSNGWHDGQDVIIKQVRHINLGGDKSAEKYYNDRKGTDL